MRSCRKKEMVMRKKSKAISITLLFVELLFFIIMDSVFGVHLSLSRDNLLYLSLLVLCPVLVLFNKWTIVYLYNFIDFVALWLNKGKQKYFGTLEKLSAFFDDKSILHKSMKKTWIWIILLVVCYLGGCFYFVPQSRFLHMESIGGESEKPLGILAKGNVYEQSFVSTGNELSGIGVRMGLYGALQHNLVTISIKDGDTTIASNTLDVYGKQDNSYQFVYFNSIPDSESKLYTVTITSQADLDQQVTLWSSKADNDLSGTLQYNGVLQSSDLDLMQTFGSATSAIPIWITITTCFIILLICLISHNKNIKKRNIAIISIYLVTLFFHSYKGVYYANYVRGFPDEHVQIQYVAAMKNDPRFIPDFKNIHVGNCSLYNNEIDCKGEPSSTSYLGHPPLYYYLMSKTNAVKIEDGRYIGNVIPLRIANFIINFAALTIFFYIGYSLITKKPLYHALFALSCTSVPMFSYLMCSVNNDNLAFFGAAVFLLGAVHYLKREDYTAHFLIAIGLCVAVMSKVTAGLMLLLGTALFIMYRVVKQHSFQSILRKEFLVTLPIYAIVVFYFIRIYMIYGTFQPSLAVLNPDYYRTTSFYTPIEFRKHMEFTKYAEYFCDKFLQTWGGVASHVALLKPNSFGWDSGALTMILLCPLLCFLKSTDEYEEDKKSWLILLKCLLLGIIITFGLQFLSAHSSFVNVGYLGGFQSRYYLCVLPILVLVSVSYFIDRPKRDDLNLIKGERIHNKIFHTLGTCIIVIIIISLFYDDFLYFLLNFQQYI